MENIQVDENDSSVGTLQFSSCCCEFVDSERGTWRRKGVFGRSGSACLSPELMEFLRMLSQNFIELFKFVYVVSFVFVT